MAAAVRLLGKGADRHLRDHEGRTAMEWARRFGSTRLLDVLLYDPNKVFPVVLSCVVSMPVFFSRAVVLRRGLPLLSATGCFIDLSVITMTEWCFAYFA